MKFGSAVDWLASSTVRRIVFCVLQVALLTVPVASFAQEPNRAVADADKASLARATRAMRKIDKNKNGTFEKDEDPTLWKRYRKLDANRDQVISVDELQRQRSPYLDTGGQRKLDVVYKRVDGRNLFLDLYYPTKNAAGPKHPIIFYTHGGGWAAGSKQGITNGSFKVVFEQLLGQGFAVASVNYRLCKKDSGVTMRDCVIDCKDAVRYLAKNGDELQLDANRCYVMGDSAGGHIAQMLLLTSPESLTGDPELANVTYKMLAGVSWYGPCDFEKTDLFNHDDRPDFNDRFAARILGNSSKEANKLQSYREVSPINFISKDSPPLLMIQGDKDTTIPVKHAYYIKQKAEAIKAPVEIMIIKNAGHNWRKVDAEIDPSRDMIVKRTVDFFLKK